jgi:DNA-binding LytR/AlgR family response regulator
VVYFESDARYTRVVHAGGEALIRTPLKELLTQLDASVFWQVHRSVIVNHRHIASAVRVDENNMVLSLRDRPERLPVSRHFQGIFKGQ